MVSAARAAVVLTLIATLHGAPPAAAHVGSPNVFFDGMAGPYAVRVIIRPPSVVPGLAEIVVLTRPGALVPEDDRFGRVLRVPAVDVSATEIRSRVRRGEGIRDRVPPEVADYIESQRLYRAGDRC